MSFDCGDLGGVSVGGVARGVFVFLSPFSPPFTTWTIPKTIKAC